MANTPPDPLGAFQSTIFSAPFGLGQKLEHLFEFWYQLAAGDAPEWRRFVMTFSDTVSQDNADDAKITFDIVNYTGGAIDDTWTDTDYQAVRTDLRAIATAWGAHMDTHHSYTKIDAYRMTFNPAWVGSPLTEKRFPFNLTGPPEFSSPESVPGAGGTGCAAPQVAMSVTEVTPIRRSWGRFYLPFPDVGLYDQTTGRWQPTHVDSIATAIQGVHNSLGAKEFQMVVPITQSQKQRVAALEQVTHIRIDNVPDVIRRRRFKHASYVKTLP